jgi:hypothetical protein
MKINGKKTNVKAIQEFKQLIKMHPQFLHFKMFKSFSTFTECAHFLNIIFFTVYKLSLTAQLTMPVNCFKTHFNINYIDCSKTKMKFSFFSILKVISPETH